MAAATAPTGASLRHLCGGENLDLHGGAPYDLASDVALHHPGESMSVMGVHGDEVDAFSNRGLDDAFGHGVGDCGLAPDALVGACQAPEVGEGVAPLRLVLLAAYEHVAPDHSGPGRGNDLEKDQLAIGGQFLQDDLGKPLRLAGPIDRHKNFAVHVSPPMVIFARSHLCSATDSPESSHNSPMRHGDAVIGA